MRFLFVLRKRRNEIPTREHWQLNGVIEVMIKNKIRAFGWI
jgi:hypothetical protein